MTMHRNPQGEGAHGGGDAPLRLFIAATLPEALQEALRAVLAQGRRQLPRLRWVQQGRLHLTLRFLGDVPPARIVEIEDDAARTLADHGPLDLTLGGWGCFPGNNRLRVLWLGVGGTGGAALERLGWQLGEQWPELNPADRQRRFQPHLTLARSRGRPERISPDALDRLPPVTLPWRVAELHLIHSTFTPQGPLYRTLRQWPLGGG